MAGSVPVGAVVGIAVAGATVVIIVVVILLVLARSRNKSHTFDPYNFDRPKSYIRGFFVDRKSRDVRKTVMMARYKPSAGRYRHSKHTGGVWLTGNDSGFVAVPLQAYSGASRGHLDYQPTGNRETNHARMSAVSEVSLDLGNVRVCPTKAGNPRASRIAVLHPDRTSTRHSSVQQFHL